MYKIIILYYRRSLFSWPQIWRQVGVVAIYVVFHYFSPRAAPTCDEILQKGDLYEVVEALLEAKDKAYELGLRLKLSPDEVKSIRNTYQDPQDRLTAIIEYLLKQVEPRPTWRLIVNALRSPLVDLPRLAKDVEAAHCPNSTATYYVLPENRNGYFHLYMVCMCHIFLSAFYSPCLCHSVCFYH